MASVSVSASPGGNRGIEVPPLVVAWIDGGWAATAVGIVDSSIQGGHRLGVVELGPELLELPFISLEGGVQRWVQLHGLEEARVELGLLVKGFVPLLEGVGS